MKTRFITILLSILSLASLSEARNKHDGIIGKLDRETTAPARDGHLGGYANVVEKVSPSVVSIFTTQTVKQRSISDYPFFFEDPLFRRFFGAPMQPEDGSRRRQQLPQQRREGLGSGVILSSDGYIVTNNHVVDGADEIKIQMADSRDTYEAEVVGRDPATDLALLKIDATGLPYAKIGDSSLLKPGDVVLAIGNPFGLSQTVTTGIVSAVGRKNLSITDYSNFIQTDASINPGNSGGALIDNQGRVIGINTAIFSRSGGNVGIGFAIPVNMAIDVLDRLATNGKVERGYLGVMLSDLNSELAEGFGVEPEGALVNDVMEDTPADKAGFEPGDIITHYRGDKVTDMADLRLRVASTEPNTEAEFSIIRNGKKKEITAKIGRLPTDDDNDDLPDSQWGSSRSDKLLSGVQVMNIDRETRSYYGIPSDVKGILVTRVDADSNAGRAGIREGDVITSIAGKNVETVNEALKAKRQIDGNIMVIRVVNQRGSRFIAIPMEDN